MAQWLALQCSAKAIQDIFPGRQNIYLLFNSDIVDFLFKTSGGRDRRPNFVIFVCGGGVEQKVLFRAGCFPGFIQGWGTQGESKISSFSF